MSSKTLVWLGASIGGIVGGYLPVLWGASAFSGWALLTSTIGGFAGLWAGWKLSNL